MIVTNDMIVTNPNSQTYCKRSTSRVIPDLGGRRLSLLESFHRHLLSVPHSSFPETGKIQKEKENICHGQKMNRYSDIEWYLSNIVPQLII